MELSRRCVRVQELLGHMWAQELGSGPRDEVAEATFKGTNRAACETRVTLESKMHTDIVNKNLAKHGKRRRLVPPQPKPSSPPVNVPKQVRAAPCRSLTPSPRGC
jgi:hypothetical protein